MHKQILLLMALLLVFVMAPPAMAEIKGGEFTFTPFIGLHVYDGTQDLAPSLTLGMRLGYNLDKNWGIESQFSYSRLRNDGNYGGVYNATGDLLYHFMPESKVVPYILVGGGWSKADFVTGDNDSGIIEYGVGIKYFVSDGVALRGDARQIITVDTPASSTVRYWQNSQFTVGFSFQFGGKKAVSPAVVIQPAAAEVKTVKEEPVLDEPSSWQAENTTASEGKILITGMQVNKNEFEIFATKPIRDYKLFTLTQPSRLVVDIPNGESGFILKKVVINRLGIATVRFESYLDYLRIFFDAAQGRLIPYRVEETARGLKIIVTSP